MALIKNLESDLNKRKSVSPASLDSLHHHLHSKEFVNVGNIIHFLAYGVYWCTFIFDSLLVEHWAWFLDLTTIYVFLLFPK